MPYICIARTDLPDGAVQVLDLQPNSSQGPQAIQPPGQTRYIPQPQNDPVKFEPNGTLFEDAKGLGAYFADRIEPGGLGQAFVKVRFTGVAGGDALNVLGEFAAGFDFACVDPGPPAAVGEFAIGIDDAATAASFIAVCNAAPEIAAMKGLAGNVADRYLHATQEVGDDPEVVTLWARHGAAVDTLGWPGCTIEVGGGATAASYDRSLDNGAIGQVQITDRLHRAVDDAVLGWINTEWWHPDLIGMVVDDIRARVAQGMALTLAALDSTSLDRAQAELTNAGGSNSTGTVADLLAILSGRGYIAPKTGVYYSPTNTPWEWNPTQRGGWTVTREVFGTTWQNGEIKPAALNADGEPMDEADYEVRPYRHTLDTDALALSLTAGTLAVFCAVPGQPPVTLWPDSDLVPFFPWTYQKHLDFPQVDNARVLTVYDDDGTVLA